MWFRGTDLAVLLGEVADFGGNLRSDGLGDGFAVDDRGLVIGR